MPEVVEVTLTSLFLNHKLKNKILTGVEILGGRYSRHPLLGLPILQINVPLTIKKICSWGKFMWFEGVSSKKRIYIMNTYGLEGMWGFTKQKHSNILFKLKHPTKQKTYNLYFTDSRNFGTLEITTVKKDLSEKLLGLGQDLLREDFSDEEFFDRVEKLCEKKTVANKEIYKILMDQTSSTGLGAGIGNYLVSNILYTAGMSPHKKLKELCGNKNQCSKLSVAIRYELKLAYLTEDIGYMEHIDRKIDKFVKKLRDSIKANKNHKYNFHPDTHLGNAKFKFYVYRQKTDPDGHPVKGDEIIKKRTSYWSPAVQK